MIIPMITISFVVSTVGLHPLPVSIVRESETILVCAELISGSLERNITVTVEAINSSAKGIYYYTEFFIHHYGSYVIVIVSLSIST